MRPNLLGINRRGRGHSTSVIEATDYRHELLRLRDHGAGLRKGPTVSRGEEEAKGKLQPKMYDPWQGKTYWLRISLGWIGWVGLALISLLRDFD